MRDWRTSLHHQHAWWRWLLIVLIVASIAGGWRVFGTYGWLFAFLIVVPLLARYFETPAAQTSAKRKRARARDAGGAVNCSRLEDDLEDGEKPKRRPRYVVGDDGELVEVIDDSVDPVDRPDARDERLIV
jgi:hypothetical protein